MSLSFIFRFGSGFPAFAVAPLLLCSSSLSSLLRFKSAVTCARLVITHSSASLVFQPAGSEPRSPLFVERGIVDRVRRLLSIHEVVELRLIFFERFFNSATHFRPFPSVRPARQLFFCFFLRWTGQSSSCAGDGGLSSLESVDHCHPFFLLDVLEQ